MKKKILTLCLVAALAATAVIGGTLAYFTDKDTHKNVFTSGTDTDIEIEEEFPDPELFPDVPVVKKVKVTNEGEVDVYMWIELWIPEELCGNNQDASKNALHFNPYDTYKDNEGNLYAVSAKEAAEKGYTDPVGVTTWEVYEGTRIIEGKSYSGCRIWIQGDTPKQTGDSTYELLSQVYMDKHVIKCTEKTLTCTITPSKEHLHSEECYEYNEGHSDTCLILPDGTHYDGSWEIIVDAFGMQAQGFDTIDEAMKAYYEENPVFPEP